MNEKNHKSIESHLARLLWQSPEGKELETLVKTVITTIGRSKDCDVVILDTRLSRKHAEIRYDGDTFIIADLGSANGTYLNGERIQEPLSLQDHDLIKAGPVEFRFEYIPVPEKFIGVAIPKRSTLIVPEPEAIPWMEVRSGPQKGTHFELTQDRLFVGRAGRGQRWDITLQDRAVSRPHAEITREGSAFTLTDLDSANGTLVNGELIRNPYLLQDGDAITFGEMVLVFRTGG